MEQPAGLDLVTVGRISVDLYAREVGRGFRDPQTFSKSVGGSPTNVAVAAARLGRSAAIVTKVGDDDFGRFARDQLEGWGVTTDYVGIDSTAPTPLAFAALDPPEDPQVLFYRGVIAPDTTLEEADLPADVVRECRVFWMSLGALSQGTTADTSFAWLEQRGRVHHTVLDLDYRTRLWPDAASARAAAQRAIEGSSIVVGNRAECAMALGTSEPDDAATELMARGVGLAIIKLGGGGVLLSTATQSIRVEPIRVPVVCGLGAGDAFGGALVHGLLSDWDLDTIGRFANAAGAFVVGQLTCADAMPTVAQVEALLAASAAGVRAGELGP